MRTLLPIWRWQGTLIRLDWLLVGFAYGIESQNGWLLVRHVRLPLPVIEWLGEVTGLKRRLGV